MSPTDSKAEASTKAAAGHSRGADEALAAELEGVERIAPPQHRAALARLLGQGSLAADEQVRHFLDAAADLQLSLQWMWGRPAGGGEYRSVVLIAPQAGATGTVILSRPRGRRDVTDHATLVDFACRHSPPDQIGMAQALLTPDQELERLALEQARFEHLATLSYLQRRISRTGRDPADRTVEPIDWPADAKLLQYTEERRPLFLKALNASYERTLDCPALYGRRNLDDVLRGHMATGQFDPAIWTLLMIGGEPAGVLLLNPVPTAGVVELVYLGLGVRFRGRGLASRLLRRALQQCRERGETTLTLAVDEANHPARQLYDRFAFRRTTRRVALVRHLR